MRAYERFLQYVTVGTRSDEASGTVPSSPGQLTLGRLLADELRGLGADDAALDEASGCVYGHLPATAGRASDPVIGFLAHMDTADFPGEGVRPQLHPDYDGGVLPIGGGLTLDPARFPHLPSLRGRTLITASGGTLLGADDKAGIAEILTMVQRLRDENLPHGPLAIAFTPDEEIGRGTDHFDLARFGAAFAYTVDGGAAGELEYENFNAAEAAFTFRGVDVHPGSAKGVLVNALLVAAEAVALLPAAECPRCTEGYEGFYHVHHMAGSVTEASLRLLVRDHDAASFACRLQTLAHVEKALNEKWGAGTAALTVRQQYRNMAEVVRQHPEVVARAERACRAAGLTPITQPIRGGTDGAFLSWQGLPCPNLGTGGYAAHGPWEHIAAEDLDAVTDQLTHLATEAFS